MFNPISWFQGLFGGNKAQQAYNQVPQAQKDLVAYKAGIGAGIPGQPSTYATTAPIDNIPAKYAPPPSPAQLTVFPCPASRERPPAHRIGRCLDLRVIQHTET